MLRKNFNQLGLGLLAVSLFQLVGCNQTKKEGISLAPDLYIVNGQVFNDDKKRLEALDVAICADKICGVFPSGSRHLTATNTIDAKGMVVSPGFIDPHTHSLAELTSEDNKLNLNYLTQGVTTVVNGNDGGGPVDINAAAEHFNAHGIGTNVALYVGHNQLRKSVMGLEKRAATQEEINQMSALLAEGMKAGAIGLSTGLYYVPGNYASTQEVIELARVAHQHGGIYDTHLRDESSFNIGFIEALKEAIEIARKSGIHLHLAHLKALGVDVWGTSAEAISLIEQAQKEGIGVSADQYPWLASGTSVKSAIIPQWVRADSQEAFIKRLNDESLLPKIKAEIRENIRRRGGPDSLLITSFHDESLMGKTLEYVAKEREMLPEDVAISIVQEGKVRLASFNMNKLDVDNFMRQTWVVTSSDGSDGHPRKYASFPQKLNEFVKKERLMSLTDFIYKSSTQSAKFLRLDNRGSIQKGYYADIVIFNPQKVKVNADFTNWNRLSEGMSHVIVNGEHVVKEGKASGKLAGRFVQ